MKTITRRDFIKGGAGAASFSVTGCIGRASPGATQRPLMWTYAFPNDGTKPVWRNAFEQRFQNETGREINISLLSYEDIAQKFIIGGETGNPDAVEGVLSNLSQYLQADNLQSLTNRIENIDWMDGYADNTLEALRFEGDLYGLPYTGNGRALIYRKDILKKLGQDPPKTASEFHEIGRMINKEIDGIQAYHNCTTAGSVRAFQEWMSHVYQHTDEMFVKRGDSWSLNISADVLGLIFNNWYYQVWAADNPLCNPNLRGTGWQTNDYGYVNGQFAMIECGPWLRGSDAGESVDDAEVASRRLSEQTAVANLPHAKEGHVGTFLEVKPVMLNKFSDQKNLGWEAVKAFASPKVMQVGARNEPGTFYTPVHDAVESPIENKDWEPFLDVFKTGRALAKIGWGPVQESFYTYMQQVVYGQTDPYRAGKQLHSELKQFAGTL